MRLTNVNLFPQYFYMSFEDFLKDQNRKDAEKERQKTDQEKKSGEEKQKFIDQSTKLLNDLVEPKIKELIKTLNSVQDFSAQQGMYEPANYAYGKVKAFYIDRKGKIVQIIVIASTLTRKIELAANFIHAYMPVKDNPSADYDLTEFTADILEKFVTKKIEQLMDIK